MIVGERGGGGLRSGGLQTFVTVADLGSVRAAAARLRVTESAVSAAMASLQRDLGVALVEREGRGLRLTPAGIAYAGYGRRILGLLAEARLAAHGEAPGRPGLLRVAAVTSAGEDLLPGLLAGFRARHPQIGLALEVSTRQLVWTFLGNHQVDVVIAGRPPDGADLVTRALRPNQLVVVAAPSLVGADVRTLPWLLRELGSGTRETTESLLESLQADPLRLTLGSNRAVIAGAAAGLGVTLVSRAAVEPEISGGRLRVLAVPGSPLHRPYHVVTHRHVPSACRLFLDHLLSQTDADGSQAFVVPGPGQGG